MTDLEKKIFEAIAGSGGIRSATIADILHVDKALVNTTLSKSKVLKSVVRQGTDYKWHLIGSEAKEAENQTKTNPDEDLKRLCEYYLRCISLESGSSVSQFLSSRFGCQYAVLSDLKIDSENDVAAISLLNKVSNNRDKRAYVGYPIKIFTLYGKGGIPYKRIAPVFLFPVTYTSGVIEISWIPIVNMEVVKRYCVGSVETLTRELVSLETELGMNDPESDVGVDELVLRLRNIRDWEWRETIDPYHIPEAGDITGLDDGLYNRPVLIEAEKNAYTDGLESELMALSLMSEERFRETALYAWVKDKNQSETPSPPSKQILEVLPLNTEQAMAVETALNADLTIVTGPPGTGKSQVVTDLLATIAWNGKSALFSSRNNKAVDVVDKRVNGLSARPCLLRIGNYQYASRLAEIIEGLLNCSASIEDQTELQDLQRQYETMMSSESELRARKDELVQTRNALDETERHYCQVRDVIGDNLFRLDENDVGTISKYARSYCTALRRAKKEENGLFARLFWSHVKPRRIAALNAAENMYGDCAAKYGLVHVDPSHSLENADAVLRSANEFEHAAAIAISYRTSLMHARDKCSLEAIDQKLLSLKKMRADVAQRLWDKWLKTNRAAFSPKERKEMGAFVAEIRLLKDVGLQDNPDLRKMFSKMIQLMTRYLQCWAVTSLSAKSRIPFEAGLFDYVIIDEASQCDIASMIPLLFRSKRAVIIGDPKQLSHISQLTPRQDLNLLRLYSVNPVWSYSANSLYALAVTKALPKHVIQLRDHFRSCAEIIEYSNETFYDGTLRTATDYARLVSPPGDKPGIRWIHVSGTTIRPSSGSAYNQEEVQHVVNELRRLIQAGYTGTIGVTTPFHLQAEKIKKALEKDPDLLGSLVREHDFLADTVHKFQGDERDLMIFSCVVSRDAQSGTIGFLNSTGNLFNVAVTRARSTLTVVGDYQYCSECGVAYLRQFSAYYAKLTKGVRQHVVHEHSVYTRDYPSVSNAMEVSKWEKVLYTALFDKGIRTIPQYSADRYRLDLAIIMANGRKLDIEIDGEMYHRDWSKELCYRDQLRNQRLIELGWDVKRFWVYLIRDDLEWCVKQVKDWCEKP
ncbi:MAG: AAA family ATPase [Kiritimatiellae bacterium]|nr:AAA family ATPase [Kiritimatiellia bacterium]